MVNHNFRSDDNAHYLFTPRNLNGIVNHLESYGIDFNDLNQILNAVCYEVNRQFGDRLINFKSKQKFMKLVQPIFGSLTQRYRLEESKLLPCSQEDYQKVLSEAIKHYENEVKPTNITLIDEAIDLMSAIEKILLDGGHMLIAGTSGTLRKTATRVIAHHHKVNLMTLSNIRNPSMKEFFKDLRGIIEVAAGQNKRVLLFLEEHQLGKNVFYEKVNSLISSGEIAGLFLSDELEGLIQDPEQLKS